ncbi:MAG: tetratricopeptide repeat protein [Betaproteobacteria bacterium]
MPFRLNDRGLRPEVSVARLIETGFEHHRAGNSSLARAAYAEILAAHPHHADANYLTGLICAAEGDHAVALSHIERAMSADGTQAAYPLSAASSLRALGRHDEAIERYRAALRLDPDDTQILDDLGTALEEAGAYAEAIPLLERAVARAPGDWRVHYHLGNALRGADRNVEAAERYRQAVLINPDSAEAHNNLGVAAQQTGALAQARASFEAALALAPDYPDAHNNLGACLHALERTEQAVDCFERALALDPIHPLARVNRAQALQELGRWREAITAYETALAGGGRPGVQVRLATVLPVVARSSAEIVEARERFGAGIDALAEQGIRLAHPEKEVASCNFHLAYHGFGNRVLQQKIANLYLQACPELGWRAPHVDRGPRRSGPIRVGLISRFLRNHSIGKTSRGLFAQITRPDFEVIALFAPPFVDDGMSRFIAQNADRNVILPGELGAARETIAALELDVLFYQDIGMDPFTYYLAFARLAPVQCVSFGHPDTTGIPNMDWWVSTEDFEIPDAPSHYSERLWRARGIGTLAYYYRPPVPAEPKSRRELGLPEGRAIYFCPHSLFRIHPDFDAIFGAILARDPTSEIIMIEGTQPHWTTLFRERLGRTLGPDLGRVRILPLQPHTAYLNLMQVADAMLDPIYFNGMNNSLDAFAVGLPIVTLPHVFQRGRHTNGIYRHMGWTGCVAADPADYANIAWRLAHDPDFRVEARHEIAQRRDTLFEDPRVPREFERFFHETVGR